MDISIQPIQEADLPVIGRQLFESKFSLSINRLLWKNWPEMDLQREQSLGAVTGSIGDSEATMLKAVDNKSSEILGFAVFTKRPASPPKPDSDGPSAKDIPERFNPDVLLTVMKASGEIAKEIETFERLEVTVMIVQPSQRRKGIASQLLSTLFDRARAENLPIVAQSEPASNDFFLKKHGFTETKHVDFDLSKWTFPMSGYGLFRLTGVVWRP